MEEALKYYREHYYQILLADIAFGLVLGLIPLILGIKKQKRNLGIIGFIISIIVAVFTPILSIINAVIFTLLILKSSKTAAKPVDIKAKDSDNL